MVSINNKNSDSKSLDFFSVKKTRVSFILSLLVFFIHFTCFSSFSHFTTMSVSGKIWSTTKAVLLPISTVAVPLFFFISAVMFYRNYTLKDTFRKWKSRFYSLCIPYLAWNTAWYILALLGYYTPLSSFLDGVKTSLSINSMLQGIIFHGFFEPFWFVLELIVLVFLCPVIYVMVKNKWIGIISVLVSCVLYVMGFRFSGPLLINTNVVIFYLIGAWIGLHGFDLFSVQKTTPIISIGCVVVFYFCCFCSNKIDAFISTESWIDAVDLLMNLLCCFTFWFGCDIICTKKSYPFEKESFLIYAMHSLVGATVSKVIYVLLPKTDFFLAINAIVTFVITVVIICLFGMILGKRFPSIKKTLTGGR